jgi:ABC-type transport system involved in cytochrome c biogenesis permease subunit
MDWQFLGWLALVLYLAAEALSIASLLRPRLPALAPWALAAGIALQFVDLHARAKALGSVPYRTLAGSMALFGWMLGVTCLVLLWKHRERSIAPFLIPFVILFSAVGLMIPFAPSPPRPETQGALFALHVTLAILGYAAFAFSFVLSLLYLIQSHQIRRARTGLLFARLPALEAIGGMNRTAVTIGLASLFVSTLLGAAWAERVWQTLGDAKLVWALFTLAVYGLLLWMDRRGWKGQRVAILSIVGFGLVLFSYTFVNLYLSRAHTFR